MTDAMEVGLQNSVSWAWIEKDLSALSIPKNAGRVFKDECLISFDTAKSEDGLFINATTFQSYSKRYVYWDSINSRNQIYFCFKAKKKGIVESEGIISKVKPSKLALGTIDGFNVEDSSEVYNMHYSLVIPFKNICIPMDLSNLPPIVSKVFDYIQNHPGEKKSAAITTWENQLIPSKYADELIQIDHPPSIPPSNWRCEVCGATDNLWLNLSDGFIGCGRKWYMHGGGCLDGNEGAALLHYAETGSKYHLAVKLGTITAHAADVFSYAQDENDAVLDPKLSQHLAHFGINIQLLEKTTKTTTELEIDENLTHDWNSVTESGMDLEVLSGPGYRGLKNLGNSCYVNSVVQVLASVSEILANFHLYYATMISTIYKGLCPADVFAIQFGKLIYGLTTEQGFVDSSLLLTNGIDGNMNIDESASTLPESWLDPSMFKYLVGYNHAEFGTGRQQDAEEYIAHLFSLIEKMDTKIYSYDSLDMYTPIKHLFYFWVEQRLECLQSHQVRYDSVMNHLISLDIPLDAAIKSSEVEQNGGADNQLKRQKTDSESDFQGENSSSMIEGSSKESTRLVVPFQACLDTWAAEDIRDHYFSPVTQQIGKLSHKNRIKTFPPYLIVHLKRFYAAEDWTAKKLDCLVAVPEVLNLESLRGFGPQEDEEIMVEVNEDASLASVIEPNESIVKAIMQLGFTELDAQRACIFTNNANVEICIEWLLTHMENEPPADPTDSAVLGELDVSKITSFVDLDYSEAQIREALIASRNNENDAVLWLSNKYGITGRSGLNKRKEEQPSLADGKESYSLMAIISHIGKNASSGHYVAHIKKEGRWIIFNDAKVAVSQSPPFDLGYIYIFKRNAC